MPRTHTHPNHARRPPRAPQPQCTTAFIKYLRQTDAVILRIGSAAVRDDVFALLDEYAPLVMDAREVRGAWGVCVCVCFGSTPRPPTHPRAPTPADGMGGGTVDARVYWIWGGRVIIVLSSCHRS